MASAELFGDEDESIKPSKFEAFLADKLGKRRRMYCSILPLVLAVAFAIGLFILLPALLSGLLRSLVHSNIVINLIEGVIRLGIFLIYLVLVSRMKDIRSGL